MAEIIYDERETIDKKRVYFYECDYKNRLKLSEILKIAAEIAGHDYTVKGFTHEFLWERGMVFLVSKVSFNIRKYPCSQQKVIISTWECGKKGAVFNRGFAIIDKETNEILIEGIAQWILVNPETRRIMRSKDFPYDMPAITDRETMSIPNGKIDAPELILIGQHEVKISDIDGNGHVYNANYADMAVNFVAEEIYERDILNFRINFVHEAKLGDTIDIYGYVDGERVVVVGRVEDNDCFAAEFYVI